LEYLVSFSSSREKNWGGSAGKNENRKPCPQREKARPKKTKEKKTKSGGWDPLLMQKKLDRFREGGSSDLGRKV